MTAMTNVRQLIARTLGLVLRNELPGSADLWTCDSNENCLQFVCKIISTADAVTVFEVAGMPASPSLAEQLDRLLANISVVDSINFYAYFESDTCTIGCEVPTSCDVMTDLGEVEYTEYDLSYYDIAEFTFDGTALRARQS